jgi:hypothetical protein
MLRSLKFGFFDNALKIMINPYGEMSLLFIYKDSILKWVFKNWESYAAPGSPINLSLMMTRVELLKGYNLAEIDINNLNVSRYVSKCK